MVGVSDKQISITYLCSWLSYSLPSSSAAPQYESLVTQYVNIYWVFMTFHNTSGFMFYFAGLKRCRKSVSYEIK